MSELSNLWATDIVTMSCLGKQTIAISGLRASQDVRVDRGLVNGIEEMFPWVVLKTHNSNSMLDTQTHTRDTLRTPIRHARNFEANWIS